MYNLLLFDLDGTVCNTNNLIINSLKHVLSLADDTQHSEEYLLKFWGKPLHFQLCNFLPGRDDYEYLTNAYRNYYNEHQLDYLAEFPGMRQALDNFSLSKKSTGIVTSKLTRYAIETLDLLDYSRYFDFVIGCDMVVKVKPDPEPILKAVKLSGIDCHETIYIGDNIDDIIAAKKSNVSSAVVRWSLTDNNLLQQENPDFLFSSAKEMVELLT
jgi:pyrophosphatase PpaX